MKQKTTKIKEIEQLDILKKITQENFLRKMCGEKYIFIIIIDIY